MKAIYLVAVLLACPFTFVFPSNAESQNVLCFFLKNTLDRGYTWDIYDFIANRHITDIYIEKNTRAPVCATAESGRARIGTKFKGNPTYTEFVVLREGEEINPGQ